MIATGLASGSGNVCEQQRAPPVAGPPSRPPPPPAPSASRPPQPMHSKEKKKEERGREQQHQQTLFEAMPTAQRFFLSKAALRAASQNGPISETELREEAALEVRQFPSEKVGKKTEQASVFWCENCDRSFATPGGVRLHQMHVHCGRESSNAKRSKLEGASTARSFSGMI
eukprot:scaffold14640_cov146-Isochrysis_galbana.AAC.2